MHEDEFGAIARGTLAHALEGMDETTRVVLTLLYVEKLTVEEAALALGLESADVLRAAERARVLLLDRVHDRASIGVAGRHEGRAA